MKFDHKVKATKNKTLAPPPTREFIVNKVIMKIKPCIIGLGYVGLPVILNLSKKFKCLGFDVDKKRVLDFLDGTGCENLI